MITIIPFVPSNIRRFKFFAQLDNAKYTIETSWNVSAQRFYIDIYTSDGRWIITTPLVGSPPGRPIGDVVWNQPRGIMTVTMGDPTTWPIPLSPGGLATKPGTFMDYTLTGFQPDTYNGKFRGMHVDEITFEVPMTTNPGSLIITGFVNRYLNMIETVFETSTLIYRNNAFEIGP
jgi:hypothetical protein